MQPLLTEDDLRLIRKLEKRPYRNNSMASACSEEERQKFNHIKNQLDEAARLFADEYAGFASRRQPFRIATNKGNPLSIGGKRLKTLWSGIYRGNVNKQYAAQISFVLHADEDCLHVGFYFGRMSSHIRSERTDQMARDLRSISREIASILSRDDDCRTQYYNLPEYGFKAYCNQKEVSMEEWLNSIINHPHKCEIYAKLHPDNKNKEITYSQIDFYAKQLLFLISCFRNGGHIPLVPPPSPAERALQAEKLAEIGVQGEQFILEREQEKLDRLGLLDKDYPKHVALISDSYGYDILSRDEQGKELYIEVKTTTRKEGEWGANRFYLSAREYAFYREHKEQYRLYRVHDINGTPTFTVFSDLDKLELQPDSYVAQY